MSSIAPFGIYFLDVGQGDCSFVCPPGNSPILVDCADAIVARRFVDDHSKIADLEAVVVSHLDDDHIKGMLPLLQGFMAEGRKIRSVYLAIERDRKRLGKGAAALIEQVIEWSEQKRFVLRSPTREGDPLTVCRGENWCVDLVLPWTAQRLRGQMLSAHRPNSLSAVIRISVQGRVVMIGADATLASWEHLDAELFKANVFRTPHHGGDISEGAPKMNVADLYRQMAPEVVVFSVGTTNSYQHPLPEHMADSAAGGSCRRVCTQLTRRCHPNPEVLRDESVIRGGVTYSYSRYLNPKEVPCAGSVVITVDAAGNIDTEPPSSQHDAFIDLMKHPLCRVPPP